MPLVRKNSVNRWPGIFNAFRLSLAFVQLEVWCPPRMRPPWLCTVSLSVYSLANHTRDYNPNRGISLRWEPERLVKFCRGGFSVSSQSLSQKPRLLLLPSQADCQHSPQNPQPLDPDALTAGPAGESSCAIRGGPLVSTHSAASSDGSQRTGGSAAVPPLTTAVEPSPPATSRLPFSA